MSALIGSAMYPLVGLFLLPACVQRMNDAGVARWFAVMSCVPFVNLGYWLVCMFLPPKVR